MALTQEETTQLETLAERVLTGYDFTGPPVPVERILSHPPLGIEPVDISDLSLVFGAGRHQYDYRLALGRLLYREILRMGDDADQLPFSSEAAAYFAMALLLPAPWVTASAADPTTDIGALSERYQVSAGTMFLRVKQLGMGSGEE